MNWSLTSLGIAAIDALPWMGLWLDEPAFTNFARMPGLFAPSKKVKPFGIKRMRPLLPKHPGGGGYGKCARVQLCG